MSQNSATPGADKLLESFNPWRIACLVGAGASILWTLPVGLVASQELAVVAEFYPWRLACQLFGSYGLLSSVLAQGIFPSLVPDFLAKAIVRVFPNIDGGAATLASIGLRLFGASLSFFSLGRSLNPKPGILRDLAGKTAVVTGGLSGLGLQTTKRLLMQGASVIIVDKHSGEGVVQTLRHEHPGAQVTTLKVNLENLMDVAALAPTFASLAPHGVDILVLNAGYAPLPPAVKGPSGYESSFTVMFLSHFLLCKLLWPCLTCEARVVFTSSSAHVFARGVDDIFEGVENLDPEMAKSSQVLSDGTRLYARAKLALNVFARELGGYASRDARNIQVSAHHPGTVATSIWTSSLRLPPLLTFAVDLIAKATMRSAEAGAAPLINAAAGLLPLVGQDMAPNGSYYVSSHIVNCTSFWRFHPLINDATTARKIWDKAEQLIAPFSPPNASWTPK